MKPLVTRLFSAETAGGASGGSAPPAPAWKPFDASKHGAETPFKVRKDKEEATVILSQHGQLLLADTRRLLGWEPDQMA